MDKKFEKKTLNPDDYKHIESAANIARSILKAPIKIAKLCKWAMVDVIIKGKCQKFNG